MSEPTDLTDPTGAVVISIEVLRAGRSRPPGQCTHHRTVLDEELAELTCRDCGTKLSPIQWIKRLAEHWADVVRQRKSLRAEGARLEQKRRVRCQSCGTIMRLIGSREDEQRRRQTREARMREALEHIAQLVPEAAAQHAAAIAKRTLAATDV